MLTPKIENATGDLIVAFGEVASPPNENEAGSSLLALINDIREEFGNAIREDTFRQGVGAMILKPKLGASWAETGGSTRHRRVPICSHHRRRNSDFGAT